ncbi:MAG: hypothetical protein Q4C47_04435 [Planctomycetia bacterium]|nr:hypothetical protein [Planctomycetia bacterium]
MECQANWRWMDGEPVERRCGLAELAGSRWSAERPVGRDRAKSRTITERSRREQSYGE